MAWDFRAKRGSQTRSRDDSSLLQTFRLIARTILIYPKIGAALQSTWLVAFRNMIENFRLYTVQGRGLPKISERTQQSIEGLTAVTGTRSFTQQWQEPLSRVCFMSRLSAFLFLCIRGRWKGNVHFCVARQVRKLWQCLVRGRRGSLIISRYSRLRLHPPLAWSISSSVLSVRVLRIWAMCWRSRTCRRRWPWRLQ